MSYAPAGRGPVYGERRIIRKTGDSGGFYIILQEYRSAWFGLSGRWVKLCHAYGNPRYRGELEQAELSVRALADQDFSGDARVLWRSTDGLP